MDIHKVCYLPQGLSKKLPMESTLRAPFRQKIKYWYHRLTRLSEDVPITRQYFVSRKQIEQERLRHMNSKYWFCIHPFSKFNQYWQYVMILTWSFILVYDIYINAFIRRLLVHEDFDIRTGPIFVISYRCNDVCLLNMIITCFTGYIDQTTNRIILHPLKSLQNYLKFWFWIDGVTFHVIYRRYVLNNIFYEKYSFESESNLINLIRYFRLVRLFTIYQYLDILRQKVKMSYILFSFLWGIFSIGLVIHFNACLYYFLTEELNILYPTRKNNTWIHVLERKYEREGIKLPSVHIYGYCAQEMIKKINGLGVINAILPRNTASNIIHIYTCLVGYVTRIIIFTYVYKLFSHWYKTSLDFEENTMLLQSFFEKKFTPTDLQKKIFTQQREKSYMTFAKFKYLNASLTAETSGYLMKNKIVESRGFQDITREIFYEIAKFMHPELFLPNEAIFRFGDYADKFYGIIYGSVAMYLENDFEIMHLKENDYFGFGVLDDKQMRRMTVISIETTEVWYILKEDFLFLLSVSPQFGNLIFELEDSFKGLVRRKISERIIAKRREGSHDVATTSGIDYRNRYL